MNESDPLLVDTGRGFSIQYNGRWLYSRHYPKAAPLATIASTPITPETLYLVPSPCLCYGLLELLSRIPESSAILCIEADTRLMAITASILNDYPGYTQSGMPRLATCHPIDAILTYKALESSISTGRFRRVVEVRLSGARFLYESEYEEALSSIDLDIGLRYRNRLSLVRMGRLWARNVITNLGNIDWTSITPYRFEAKPVVVCGAGPSLDCALHLLRSRRDAITILACDTASGALAKAGIIPDAVVCLEAQVYNVRDFLPLARTRVHLIADISSHPASFHNVYGTKSLTLSQWTESAFLSRLAKAGLPITAVPPLGSVGVLAMRMAGLAGTPLIVAGLDFSYSQGKTHCQGSPSDCTARYTETRLERNSRAWELSFRDGSQRTGKGFLTDPALSMYAALAREELTGVDGHDMRCGLGVALPLTALHSDSLDTLIGSSPGHKEGNTIGMHPDPEANRNSAMAFLRGELAIVETTAHALRHGASDDELRSLLIQADLLYSHFPDPERVLDLQADALRRVAAEAAYWRGRLLAALT